MIYWNASNVHPVYIIICIPLLILLDVECIQVCCVKYKNDLWGEVWSYSNDITEHPHGDRPRPCLCTVCDKRFTQKRDLKRHKQIRTGDMLYSCTQCDIHHEIQSMCMAPNGHGFFAFLFHVWCHPAQWTRTRPRSYHVVWFESWETCLSRQCYLLLSSQTDSSCPAVVECRVG